MEVVFTHAQFVLLYVQYGNDQSWFLSIVSGHLNLGLRRKFWEDLDAFKLNFSYLMPRLS